MTQSHDALVPLGWDEGWATALAHSPDGAVPGRVLQHHGAGLLLALPDGPETVMFTQRLDPAPTVGDWVAVVDGEAVVVLPRRSLLRRRNAHGEGQQSLAANIDTVLLVCGLDRPVKDGRIQRGTAIAHDAGARPVVVLTKAERAGVDVDAERVADELRAAHPGLDVVITSAKEGVGLDELRSIIGNGTVTLLGESGAGKSSIVNALAGEQVVATGDVRETDSKGRHTTTRRELHPLPSGGVLIDTPGIRAVGIVAEPDAVAETFGEVDDVADGCRFVDCQHEGQPGCAIAAALADGTLDPARVEAWRALHAESTGEVTRASAPPRRSRRPGGR